MQIGDRVKIKDDQWVNDFWIDKRHLLVGEIVSVYVTGEAEIRLDNPPPEAWSTVVLSPDSLEIL